MCYIFKRFAHLKYFLKNNYHVTQPNFDKVFG